MLRSLQATSETLLSGYFLLWQVDNEIELLGSDEKTYLKIVGDEEPTVEYVFYGHEPIQVLDAELAKSLDRISENQKRRAKEEYKQYRETYGR
jgi:hypothetical protein